MANAQNGLAMEISIASRKRYAAFSNLHRSTQPNIMVKHINSTAD